MTLPERTPVLPCAHRRGSSAKAPRGPPRPRFLLGLDRAAVLQRSPLSALAQLDPGSLDWGGGLLLAQEVGAGPQHFVWVRTSPLSPALSAAQRERRTTAARKNAQRVPFAGPGKQPASGAEERPRARRPASPLLSGSLGFLLGVKGRAAQAAGIGGGGGFFLLSRRGSPSLGASPWPCADPPPGGQEVIAETQRRCV